MGILSGLKSLGLGNLEDVSLFEEPKKKEAEKQEQVAAPKVQEKDLIYERVRGYDGTGDAGIVTEHIRRIRKKLGETDGKQWIETVWGVGYRWIG